MDILETPGTRLTSVARLRAMRSQIRCVVNLCIDEYQIVAFEGLLADIYFAKSNFLANGEGEEGDLERLDGEEGKKISRSA